MKKSFSSKIMPWLFLTPTLIFVGIFSYYAIGKAFVDSFTDATFGIKSNWIGLQNYINAFQDVVFRTAMRNQLAITVTTVVNSVFFPLLAAELIFFVRNKRIAGIVKTLSEKE